MSSVDAEDSNKRKNIEELTDNVKKLIVSEDYIDLKKFDDSCRITSNTDETTPATDGVSLSLSDSKNGEKVIAKEPESTKDEQRIPEAVEPSSSQTIYDVYAHPCFPKINCQEKIIFCVDMSSELEDTPFRKNDGSQHSALSMVKRTIELFVHNKNFINKKHEYSLMVLYETATWVREFTNDILDFCDSLEDVSETQPCISSCDFGSIVQLISEKFDLALPMDLNTVPYIIRVILIYGRSNSSFHFPNQEIKDLMMLHPLLYLDVLYIHEPPSEENRSTEIYEALCDLDTQNKSYIFEVTRNITKLHNCMAKFLAHPLQRAAQKDTCYKMKEIVERQEVS